VAEKRAKTPHAAPKIDENAVAKMFEEVKILVRDLPERVSIATRDSFPGKRKRPRFHPMMFDEILGLWMRPDHGRHSAVGLLVVFSYFRDSQPWLYELGMQLYNAVTAGDKVKIEHVRRDIVSALDLIRHSPLEMEMTRSGEDEDTYIFFRHFVERLDDFLPRFSNRGKPKSLGSEPN
jgi:hypothetical protein